MKKTVITLVSIFLIAVIMLSIVLSLDIELNIKLRRKLNTLLSPYEVTTAEPAVYYLRNEHFDVDQNYKEVLSLKSETGDAYINVKNLNLDIVTAQMDTTNGVLSIVYDNVHLNIDLEGRVTFNKTPLTSIVDLKKINEDFYVNLSNLNAFPEGEALGFYEKIGKSDNLIIMNRFESYAYAKIQNELWLFESPELLTKYNKSQFEMSHLFEFKNVFFKTEIVNQIKKGRVIHYPAGDGIAWIVDEENGVGYVNQLESTVETEATRSFAKSKHTEYQDGIIMTWEAVYGSNPDTTSITEMKGLNVISPTWYELSNETGAVDSKVSQDYVAWAKSNRYELWPLVSNAFDIDRTHAFLKDAQARQAFIDYMIKEAISYGYEGINIDFENVYLEDRDRLTHFVNEFAVYANQANITLSMDVTVMGGSDNWSKCYDHEKLGKIVDFLVIMAYDEFWASSPISGPVASYDWVLKHMAQISVVVEHDKLIMGLPFYTRVWREYPSDSKANVSVTKSTAIGMEAQNALIEKYQLSLVWDDVDKLYYATFFEEDAQVKIWIENATTLQEKLKIVSILDLKGVAGWRRGFETQDIWNVLNQIKP